MNCILLPFLQQPLPPKECTKCGTPDDLLTITEEDLCTHCQFEYKIEYYCVSCYKMKMYKRICFNCRSFYHCKRKLPMKLKLHIENPDEMQNRCNMCNLLPHSVFYRPSDLFCTPCIKNNNDARYVCNYCFETYKDKYAPCFYCMDICFANPDKIQYKKI